METTEEVRSTSTLELMRQTTINDLSDLPGAIKSAGVVFVEARAGGHYQHLKVTKKVAQDFVSRVKPGDLIGQMLDGRCLFLCGPRKSIDL